MPVIQVLSPHIANQIAAGEVVERPCSVVKELVENAVDAHATAVEIEIDNGGINRIFVSDNGCGIPDEECETAFLRHATSKIASASDLAHIGTLGFRGEALASIASVSRVTMKTHTSTDELGSMLAYEGGSLIEHKRVGCPEGSSIDVRDLFYNVPARLKFLRSARAEAGAVGDYAARLILSLPEICIHYSANGKTVYRSVGDGDLLNALVSVYGVSVARHVCKVEYDDGYMRVTGYVGTPELSRPNRTGQTFVLNGRIIRSSALSAALARAFDTRIMGGRYPFAALHIRLSPTEVDVNVHPAKLEVHFADEGRVARTLCVCCTDALAREYTPSLKAVVPADDTPASLRMDLPAASPAASYTRTTDLEQAKQTPRADLRAFASHSSFSVRESAPSEHIGVPRYTLTKPVQESLTSLSERTDAPLSAPYRIIGEAFATYWLVQQEEVLYLIDQHAAHERLLYDALTQRRTHIVSQALFLPEEVTLTPPDMALFEERRPELEALGFVFAKKDETTLQLIAVPQIKGTPMKSAFLLDALHLDQPEKDRLMQTACKHAVKGGEPLTREEIETLLNELKASDSFLTCPHGRPICIRLSKLEIEKMFKRVL